MPSRRQFLHTGLNALALGLLAQRAGALTPPYPSSCVLTGSGRLRDSHPILSPDEADSSFTVDGVRFAGRWFGDPWAFRDMPFHSDEAGYPGGRNGLPGPPPGPQETADIAVIGGGLSGMATAYLLRHHRPVIFELHPRFGGTSVGEYWRGTSYSLGGAYFISPDPGSFLESFYHDLGLDRQVRISPSSDDPIELRGAIDPDFWDAPELPDADRLAFRRYRDLVNSYVENYPNIPLIDGDDNQWILDLDRLTLKQHIEQTLGAPIPRLLHAAIQGYCYSSFNAGWNEISAASGWNFIAAEEYGRWVLPGGNAGLVAALWEKLMPLEDATLPGCPPRHLRSDARVVEVRVLGRDRVRVVWHGVDKVFRTLIAKRVVMCIPKHVARHVIADLQALAPDRYNDFASIHTQPYVVANVRLTRRIAPYFYDLFELHDGLFPDEQGVEQFARVTDAVHGAFARRTHYNNGVLTLYWPLPYASARFALAPEDSVRIFAARLIPELDVTLRALGLTRADVHDVRLTRWGHAMPIATPNMIASGLCQRMRRPLMDHIFFVGADNWALPAVETCLLEAQAMRPLIEAGL